MARRLSCTGPPRRSRRRRSSGCVATRRSLGCGARRWRHSSTRTVGESSALWACVLRASGPAGSDGGGSRRWLSRSPSQQRPHAPLATSRPRGPGHSSATGLRRCSSAWPPMPTPTLPSGARPIDGSRILAHSSRRRPAPRSGLRLRTWRDCSGGATSCPETAAVRHPGAARLGASPSPASQCGWDRVAGRSCGYR